MGSALRELIVKLTADSSGYDAGTKKAIKDNEDVKKSSSGLGSGFLKGTGAALGFIGTAVGITGVGDAISGVMNYMQGAVQGAIDWQTAQIQTNTILSSGSHIIGLTAGQVDSLSNSLMHTTGVDDDVIRGAENIIAGYSTISDASFPAVTQAALDMARHFTTLTGATFDVNGATKALADALTDPAKGMRTLKQYIGTLTPAEQDAITTALKHGDAMRAQSLLLQDVQSRVKNASAAYRDSAAGGIMAFQTAMGNIQKTLGIGLLPMLSNLLDKVTPIATQFADNLPNAIATVQQKFAPFTAKIGDLIHNLQASKPFMDGLQSAFNNLKPLIPPVVIALGVLTAITFAPLALLIGVIAGIALGLKALWEATTPVRAAIGNFLGALGNLKDVLIAGIQNAISTTVARLQAFWQATEPVRTAIGNLIATAIQLRQQALEALQPAIDNVNSKLSELHSWFNDKVLPVIMAVHAFFEEKILPVLQAVGSFISGQVVAQLQRMWSFIQGSVLPVLAQLGGFLKDQIIANFQRMWSVVQGQVLPMLGQLASLTAGSVGRGFQALGNTINFVFSSIGNVLGALGRLRDTFANLHLEFPHINLPHFSIVGGFSLNPPSVPTLGINWYAKGGIVGLNGPQIVGVGDAGPEAIIPLNRGGFGGSSERDMPPINVTLQIDGRQLARILLPHQVEQIRTSAGIRSI